MTTMSWLVSADSTSTKARRRNGNVSRGQCNGELLLQLGQFGLLAAPPEAFDQSVKSPYVVGMLGAALNPAAQSEVVTIDLFRLGKIPLLGQ